MARTRATGTSEGARSFARAPRVAEPRLPSEAFALVKALSRDGRFKALLPSHRYLLLYAAVEYADGAGRFWPKVKTWATDAGVSTATVERALAAAYASRLLSRQPYARPDGTQGSTTYTFDSALLARPLTAEAPCQEKATDSRQAPSPAKDRQAASQERYQEQELEQEGEGDSSEGSLLPPDHEHADEPDGGHPLDFLADLLLGTEAKSLEPTDGGVCDDCAKPTERRYRLGSFSVCWRCASSRTGVRAAR
jgi:hypothetical protein